MSFWMQTYARLGVVRFSLGAKHGKEQNNVEGPVSFQSAFPKVGVYKGLVRGPLGRNTIETLDRI